MARHVPRHTFRCPPPPPPPPPPCHGGTAGTGDTGATGADPPHTTRHSGSGSGSDTTHPMWRHRGTARPEPPPPPPWLGKLLCRESFCCPMTFALRLCHVKADFLELCTTIPTFNIRAYGCICLGVGLGSALSPFASGSLKLYFSGWVSCRFGGLKERL